MLVHAQSINTQQFEILPTDKFKADFHSKMSVCRHELGGGVNPHDNSNPGTWRWRLSNHLRKFEMCIKFIFSSPYLRLRCCNSVASIGGTAAAAPPPFRPGNPVLCWSCPLVTPYYCRLGDLLCYNCMLYLSYHFVCVHVYFVFSLFSGLFSFVDFPSVLWYCWLGLLTCKNRLPYNLYCLGEDVKHCTIQSNVASIVCLSSVTWSIVPKRYVLEQKLLLRAYRKSYMRNRLVQKWMTLTFV